MVPVHRFALAKVREATIEAAKIAKKIGLTVSCDLNYHKKPWTQAQKVTTEIADYVNVAIGNEEDVEKVFGVKAVGADITARLRIGHADNVGAI